MKRHSSTVECRSCRACGLPFTTTTRSKKHYCSSTCGISVRRQNRLKAVEASALAHHGKEKQILVRLNAVLGSSLKKSKVNGYYFDFTDDNYLIEHTRDWGKGICSATRRFVAAQHDPRQKVLYANLKHLGPLRRSRLESAGVSVRDYLELE